MDLYLVRHGESEANANGLVCGQLDSPLTKKGVKQSQHLKSLLQTLSFDLCFTTPLERAYKTAELAYPNGVFHKIPELMEVNTGDASLLKIDSLESTVNHFKNGESVAEVYNRMTRWLEKLIHSQPVERVLIVAHGGTVGIFLHYMLKIPSSLYPAFIIDNCSITKVKCDSLNKKFKIDYVNRIAT